MTMIMRGCVSIKLVGSLRNKKLPGEWGELFDGEGGNPPRIQLYADNQGRSSGSFYTLVLRRLKFCDESFQEQLQPIFNLSIREEKYQLRFGSVGKKNDWVNSLCQVSSELRAQRASLLEQSPDPNLKDSREGEEEEEGVKKNERVLYDSCDEGQQFKVTLRHTTASEALNLRGDYILNPTGRDVQLLEVDTLNSVHDWPYKHIRRFGYARHTFSIEVGRRCSTGEGKFEFLTPDGASLVEQITKQRARTEREEKEKKLKGSNGSKGPTSQHQGAELAAPEGHIYDEPDDSGHGDGDYSSPPSLSRLDSGDGEYLILPSLSGLDLGDGDHVTTPPGLSTSDDDAGSVAAPKRLDPVGDSQVYSLPDNNPPEDAWKTRGRPEEEHVHTENYQSIKEVFESGT